MASSIDGCNLAGETNESTEGIPTHYCTHIIYYTHTFDEQNNNLYMR